MEEYILYGLERSILFKRFYYPKQFMNLEVIYPQYDIFHRMRLNNPKMEP